MKIYINYKNKTEYINTNNYESLKSIIYKYLCKNKIDTNIDDFFIEYNGIHLDVNFSLEKYNILDNYILKLHKKKRGGGFEFFTYLFKNPIQVIFCLLISLLPIIILPMGFISATSSLIKVIIEKSINSIGKYLVCTLGKVTLFSRIKLIIFIIKYIVFILMIFVIITLPLLLLCITLKGHSIMDNPKNMCGAISAGNIAGIVLTIVFIGIYICHRCGNYIINFLIMLCKKVYFLNTTITPILKIFLATYNEVKYAPIIALTFGGIEGYFAFIRILLEGVHIVLSTITELGCKTQFTKEAFIAKISEKVNNFNKKNKKIKKNISDEEDDEEDDDKKDENKTNKTNKKFVSNPFTTGLEICREDFIKCCDPNNYISIADTLTTVLNTGHISNMLKNSGLYPSFVLMIEALYESALLRLDESSQLSNNSLNEKKIYLRKLLQEKINKIPDNTKHLIKDFLDSGNEELIHNIQKQLDTIFKSNNNKINDIKYKLNFLDETMIEYARKDHSKYIPGKSLFKTLFKFIFVDIFCNISSTTKTSIDVITEMGEIIEITDMIKAATTSGLYMAIIYLISYIVIILCGIFNIF
jgi:hypothetical protein